MANLGIAKPNRETLHAQLPQIHKELANSNVTADDGYLRPVEEAEVVFQATMEMIDELYPYFEANPSLLSIFEKQWGSFIEMVEPDNIWDVSFISSYIFDVTGQMPVETHGQLERVYLSKYPDTMRDWMETSLANHKTTQKIIDEHFSDKLNLKDFDCRCQQCQGDYRAKLRDSVFNFATEQINELEEILKDDNLFDQASDYSFHYFNAKNKIDKRLNQVKFKLRRGTLNKLKGDIFDQMDKKFSFGSELIIPYLNKLDEDLVKLLRSDGLRPDLVEEEQKTRFYQQLGRGIWKGGKTLEREFKKLIKTVLALKRKDISAGILQDYLGHFWLYSDARRMNRKIIYHMGPTNSGKTYNAIQALSKAGKGCYLAPLRLLATELYDTLNDMDVKTTLLTGEEVIEVPNATHTSSTIEMVRLKEEFDVCVIDEIQMITDAQRGWAWTRALVSVCAPEVHVCGDPSAFELVQKICELCGDELEVRNYERMTNLKVMPRKIKANELQKNDAVIVFSRRNALKYKSDLERLGYKVSIVYGRLSPEVRREQARKFDSGETDLIVSTDAIAMGMNLPIKRVVFTTLSKFIDSKERIISNSEIKQIAGRAGRFNRFPDGYTTCLERVEDGLEKIQEALSETLEQKDKAMVGPDLDIFAKINSSLEKSSLPQLGLSEFLRLFNTMTFDKPFYCVNLKEMIEVTEMVEQADYGKNGLSDAEVFGFSCAPVNLGLTEHVQYFVYIVNNYVNSVAIFAEDIDDKSDNIDYLETSIKCVELYQWLARHFNNKNFEFDEMAVLKNKSEAIEKLNSLLSNKIVLRCSSCGCKLPPAHKFNICEPCFKKRRFTRRRPSRDGNKPSGNRDGSSNGKPRKRHSNRKKKSKPSGFKR